jgi:hypothetical protein
MKGVVADFVACPHVQNFLARRLKGPAVNGAVCVAYARALVALPACGRQMNRELLADRFSDWRRIALETRQARTQGALTRRPQFTANRVIVVQVERA